MADNNLELMQQELAKMERDLIFYNLLLKTADCNSLYRGLGADSKNDRIQAQHDYKNQRLIEKKNTKHGKILKRDQRTGKETGMIESVSKFLLNEMISNGA